MKLAFAPLVCSRYQPVERKEAQSGTHNSKNNNKKNKVVKPYQRFRSQGHVKKKSPKVRSKFNNDFVACLGGRNNVTDFFIFWGRPTMTLHQGQAHRNEP